jgi:HSP20 family protein
MFSIIPWKTRHDRNGGAPARSTEHPLTQMRDEFDALFDRFFGASMVPLSGDWSQQGAWGLGVNDTGKEVIVGMDAPGFEPKDFDIQVNSNVLTVRAEKTQELNEHGSNFMSERRLNRSVTLPAGTDSEQVDASYRNGVLEIRMPKKPEALAKRISVKS